MKKILSLAILLAAASPAVESRAQNNQQSNQSFQEFRKGILNDFSSFRSRILEHYSDFLNGEWHEYEPLKPEVRDSKPKPRTVPKVKPVKDIPVAEKPVKPKPEPTPEPKHEPTPEPVQKPVREPEPTPVPVQKPEPIPEPEPVRTPVPVQKPVERPKPDIEVDQFSFYNMPLQVPKVEFNVKQRLLNTSDFASQWKNLAAQDVAAQVMPSIKKIASDAGLNDFLTYRLVNDYVNSKLSDADNTTKISVIHYILANLGYNARIALTTTGIPLLLLPTEQIIYAKMALMLNGRKFYVFQPDGVDDKALNGAMIQTCTLPAEASKGRDFDLVLGELRIPVKPKSFSLEHGPLHLTGEVNENLMPILYRYPQMPIKDYARSVIQPDLRANLVKQMREQLAGMDNDADVEALLSFVQHVFEYSTDQNYHGFEKPYFVEESLYYPKNDCEDRAIFYTYFLWNALGREAQLVSFPGHEAATVKLSGPSDGTSYKFDGETFTISDPTYVGASSGMVMPDYRGIIPDIDFTYR